MEKDCSRGNRGRNQNLDLIFEDVKKPGTVSVPRLLDKLTHMQEVVRATGAFLLKEVPKESGRYTDMINDHFSLELTGVKAGSTEICLRICEPFGPLWPDDKSAGERAIETISEFMTIVEEDEEPLARVEKLIDEPIYRRRISRALYGLYPEEEQKDIRLKLGREGEKSLKWQYRQKFEELMRIPEAGEPAKIFGAITSWKLEGVITVTTKDRKIKCRYSPELTPIVLLNGGRIVEITGAGVFDKKDGMVKEITDISDIEPKSEMVLNEINSGGEEISLKHPLKVNLSFDVVDKSWTVRNDDLGIVAFGKKYETALTEFSDEFAYLVEHYRKTDDSKLSEGSIRRKKMFLDLVG